MGVELDIFGQIGQQVTGPEGTFATVLAELTLSGKACDAPGQWPPKCCASHPGYSRPSFRLLPAKIGAPQARPEPSPTIPLKAAAEHGRRRGVPRCPGSRPLSLVATQPRIGGFGAVGAPSGALRGPVRRGLTGPIGCFRLRSELSAMVGRR